MDDLYPLIQYSDPSMYGPPLTPTEVFTYLCNLLGLYLILYFFIVKEQRRILRRQVIYKVEEV
jgi:hypothetical protein